MRKDVQALINFHREEAELLNKSEIARRMNCDRRTVDKYINNPPVRASTRQYISELEPFKEIIINKVDTYGSTAMAVYKFIQKRGFKGKYGIVAKFVREHKDMCNKKATIRFETSPGLQAQVDWKENLKMTNRQGKIFTVNIFLMVLGYSRYKVMILTSDKTQDTLFRCMIEAFKYFGGIPHEILFDNMATVVDKAKTHYTKTIFNKTFSHFAADAGFEPVACRAYRPQTKGKAESLAYLTSRLLPYNGEFDTFEDLANITSEVMAEINNDTSQATDKIPASELHMEKEYLKPLPPMDLLLSYISDQKEYKISKESMVTYHGHKYSVPVKYVGEYVTVEETEDTVQIYFNRDLVVCHAKSDKKFNYKKEHIKEILKSDAMKGQSDAAIDDFIKENLSLMDKLLE